MVHVFLNDACSVIATNSWQTEVEKLSTEDQEWLAANVVVFNVTQPLWEPPPEAPSTQFLPESQMDSDFFLP